MSPGFDSSPSRRRETPNSVDLRSATLAVGSAHELYALRRREGPRLQFEGFNPVVVPPPLGPVRDEIRPLVLRLHLGDLTADEVRLLGERFATATFPKDERGQQLCRQLIEGINAFNRIVANPPASGLKAELIEDLPLARREQREYARLFAEMDFPVAAWKDDLGRLLWREHITGVLRPHEEELLFNIIRESGRELVRRKSGFATLQRIEEMSSRGA